MSNKKKTSKLAYRGKKISKYHYCYYDNILGEYLTSNHKYILPSNDFEKLSKKAQIEAITPDVSRTQSIEIGYILSRCLDIFSYFEDLHLKRGNAFNDDGTFNEDRLNDDKYYGDFFLSLNFNEHEIDIFKKYILDSLISTITYYSFEETRLELECIKSFVDICVENPRFCSIEYLNVFLNCKPFYGERIISSNVHLSLWFKDDNHDEIADLEDVATFDTNYKNIFESFDKNKSKINVSYEHEYNDLVGLCCASLYNIFKNGCIIKKCLSCGAYFVPLNRTDTIYCNRLSPKDNSKTCKEYGAIQAYKDKLKSDKASGLYRAIYMQKQMLCRRNPDIETYKNDFENFKSNTKQLKIDVRKGTKTEEEFIEWLDDIRKKN